MTENEKRGEYYSVEFDLPRRYQWSTGKYLGKLFREALDNKKLVSNRCQKCKEILWPPSKMCGRCKVEAGDDWVELPQKGTVTQYTYLVFPLWDPHYGEKFANPYPLAMIELDDGTIIRHFLEETDTDKLEEGMRVEAVWREDGERGEGTNDIQYFRTIEK